MTNKRTFKRKRKGQKFTDKKKVAKIRTTKSVNRQKKRVTRKAKKSNYTYPLFPDIPLF